LAGHGLAWLQAQRTSDRTRRLGLVTAGLLGLVGWTWHLLARQMAHSQIYDRFKPVPVGFPAFSPLPWINGAIGLTMVALFVGLTGVWYWHRSRTGIAAVALLAGLVLDLGSFGWIFEWHTYSVGRDCLRIPAPLSDLPERLAASHQRFLSVDTLVKDNYTAPPNLPTLWRMENAGGDAQLRLGRLNQLLGRRVLPAAVPDVLAVLVGTEATHVEYKHNCAWNRRDLMVEPLASKSFPRTQTSITFTVPDGAARSLAILGKLGIAVAVPDDAALVAVAVETMDGGAFKTLVRKADLQPVLDPGEHFEDQPARDEAGREFLTDRCLANLPFPETLTVRRLRLDWVGPAGVYFQVCRASLVKDLQFCFLTQLMLAGDHFRILAALPEDTGWLYENRHPAPRARLVSEVLPFPPADVLRALRTGFLPDGSRFDPLRTALVEKEEYRLAEPVDPSANVVVTARQATTTAVQTHSSRESFLVLADAFYPGWQATLDGAPTEIVQTNYVLRGVKVPPGEHAVCFAYRPRSLYLGLAISGVSALTLLGVVVWDARRRRVRFRVANAAASARRLLRTIEQQEILPVRFEATAVTSSTYPAAPALPVAEGRVRDDDGADEDVLNFHRHVENDDAVLQDSEDQHAQQRAGHGTHAARQASAADDDRGDDLQLQAGTDVGIAALGLGERDHAGPAREEPGDGVNEHLLPVHLEAAEPGGRLVGADGLAVAAEDGVPLDHGRHHCQRRQAPDARIEQSG
jgi:hypothetical protein